MIVQMRPQRVVCLVPPGDAARDLAVLEASGFRTVGGAAGGHDSTYDACGVGNIDGS